MKRVLLILAVLVLMAVGVFSAAASAAQEPSGQNDSFTAADNGAGETEITAAEGQGEDAAFSVADAEDNEDGINIKAATAWIIAVSAVFFCAIMTVVIVLAKKNSGKPKSAE